MSRRQRLDLVLVERGLASSRSRARESIAAGVVTVGGLVARKPSQGVSETDPIELAKAPRFASRGGSKLDGALGTLGIDVAGAVCVDIGASTGGFTDCVLQRGARRVYAVDVGQGQLLARLREDTRVVVMDRTNARQLTAGDFDNIIDWIFVDASFISMDKLLPSVSRILPPGGQLVALVKPQFEVGRDVARRTRGVVRDNELRLRAIARAVSMMEASGLVVRGSCESPLPGPKGNREHFVWARQGDAR